MRNGEFICWRIITKTFHERTLRDEYDKLENLLRIKGIDPDEFLNQKPNEHGDDAEENDYSDDCSECSCMYFQIQFSFSRYELKILFLLGDECCSEIQSGEKSDETSSDQGKIEVAGASTSKETHQTTGSSKNSTDEHKRPGKDRLNVS